MADIYVRPYDSGRRGSNRGLLIAVLIAFVVGGIIWWWLGHRAEQAAETPEEIVTIEETAPEVVPEKASPAPQPAPEDAIQVFVRARELIRSGKTVEGGKLLDEVISSTTDLKLKNSALRLQGSSNVEQFFSEAPSSWKKSYVVQPGDSLDRIARRNDTTISLIQKLNGVEGALIYPGQRLMLPAEPFVVEVDKSTRTMDLTMGGKRFKRYVVGLGRYGKTPLGDFKTVVHQTNPDWSPPGGGMVPFGDPRNVLGTRWMSFEDPARPELKGFGIHGTSDRESIGGETSNGCIRMLNEDVEEVFLLIPRGTKVIISE